MLEQILQLSCQMAETRNLQPLLVRAVDVALDLFNAEHGYLILVRPDDSLDFRVKRHRDGIEIAVPEISHQILRQTLADRKPIAAANAVKDPAFDTSLSVHNLQLRSVMCVPLIAHSDVIGALYLDNRIEEDVFSKSNLQFLQLFANQAAVAIENAVINDELEARVQARTAELQITNLQLQREISERLRVEQQLAEMIVERERSRVLAAFIQDASHQFYTPLSIINTAIHLLERDPQNNSRHLKTLTIAADTIHRLVKSLLIMAELDSGTQDEMRKCDLGQIADIVLEELQDHAQARQQALSVVHTHPVIISGVPEKLRQAIYQIVLNAIQYTPAGGVIAVSVCEQDGMAAVTVNDTGVGIAPDEMALIFSRFYRHDKAGTTSGLGLGLSIAQKIAENHGGRIEASSQPDVGSTFRLLIPLNSA